MPRLVPNPNHYRQGVQGVGLGFGFGSVGGGGGSGSGSGSGSSVHGRSRGGGVGVRVRERGAFFFFFFREWGGGVRVQARVRVQAFHGVLEVIRVLGLLSSTPLSRQPQTLVYWITLYGRCRTAKDLMKFKEHQVQLALTISVFYFVL